jgi:glycosyltransferase involved in cell wall biosynthesis
MAMAYRPLSSSIVVISDLVEQRSSFPPSDNAYAYDSFDPTDVRVLGGYLERLPLAAIATQLADHAEIWHYHRGPEMTCRAESEALNRRVFPISDDRGPFHSDAMVRFVEENGAPRILCIWGLGVSEALLEACSESFIIYNSIDVPALRVPPEVSRHFDLVLTGAEWQSEAVLERHPDMATAILPIGPEFASPDTFFPIAGQKEFDVVYVAAAQPYKRHDVLFDALERSERKLRALCIIGYGEDGQRLRDDAARRGLDIEFVGPPGVPHSEVNRLINRAKVGIVCGFDDGAPAILTEYMLADLPVVANAGLRCGLQYITPDTGIIAPVETFEQAIAQALESTSFSPRKTVLENWTWDHSIETFARLISKDNMRFQPAASVAFSAGSPQ